MTDPTLVDQQQELLSKMEPAAVNSAVSVLQDFGMPELAAASIAISTKRIADMLHGFAILLHRDGELTADELSAMGIQP